MESNATDYSGDPAILAKVSTAKQYKESGDEAFKKGELKAALQSWHFALMYLEGLDKNAMKSLGMARPAPEGSSEPAKERTEVDEILEKIYSNQAACHIKLKNWDRAIQSADKALKKNEQNAKALFRKAKALGEQGFLDKSLKLFAECKKLNPSDIANIEAEEGRLRALDLQREKESAKKLKGFLSKEWASSSTSEKTAPVPVAESAKIEEVVEEAKA